MLNYGRIALGASEAQEILTPYFLSPAISPDQLAASALPSVQRRCGSLPTRRTCEDQNQNPPRQQLWHHELLGQWSLSYLGFGQELRRADHWHVQMVVCAIFKERSLESRVR